MTRTYRLITASPDRPGIVARLSGLIAEHDGWLSDANQHSDTTSGWFFSRNEVLAESLPFGLNEFKELLQPIAEEFSMKWHITDSSIKKKIVLMASKQSHCLADLLHRWHSGEMDCELPCVISNHNDLRDMVEWHNIPFYQIPVTTENKSEAFAEIEQVVDKHGADAVVLARYMQILPPSLCEKMTGRMINIHHSFLPSFAGAKPYHQAAERGVKLIGATCHYVTEDLDQGPIIEQDVVRITHSDSIEDMVRKGRDCEVQVLARGLRAHLADKVIIHGNKTVVFD